MTSSLWSPLYIQATLRAAIQEAVDHLVATWRVAQQKFTDEVMHTITTLRQASFGHTERIDVLSERSQEIQGVLEDLIDSNNRLVEQIKALEAGARAHVNSMYLMQVRIDALEAARDD